MPRKTLPPTPAADLELIDDLLDQVGGTTKSRANARSTLAMFARFLAAEGSSLPEATTDDCKRWLEHRRSEVAAATVVGNWTHLRAFYRAAEDDFANPLDGRRSPMARIKMPRAPKWTRCHAATAQVRFDEVAARQVAARRRLRAV